MNDKKREQLLELAWRTAFDSVTCTVTGNATHSQQLIEEATQHIRLIDSEDWFPMARQVLRTNSYLDDHRLAEEAASMFINKKMDTSGLKVTFGGDW